MYIRKEKKVPHRFEKNFKHKDIHSFIHLFIQQTLFEALLCGWPCVKAQEIAQSPCSCILKGHTWKTTIKKQVVSTLQCIRDRTLSFQFKRAKQVESNPLGASRGLCTSSDPTELNQDCTMN